MSGMTSTQMKAAQAAAQNAGLNFETRSPQQMMAGSSKINGERPSRFRRQDPGEPSRYSGGIVMTDGSVQRFD